MSIIEKLLEEDFVKRIQRNEEKKSGVVFVTDLTRCALKSHYEERLPFLSQPSPSMTLGKLLHLGMQQYLQRKYEGQEEVTLIKEIEGVKIRGDIDFLTKDTVFEIKSGRDFKGNEPAEHHLLQTRLYMWLANREKGKIIYVTLGRLAEYDIDRPMSDDEVRILLKDKATPRWTEWECDYCLYRSICPKSITK